MSTFSLSNNTMIRSLLLLCAYAYLCVSFSVNAQTLAQLRTVSISATVQANVPRIRLSWPAITNSNAILVYRRLKTDPNWGNAMPSLPGTATSFDDSTAEAGRAYEYRVVSSGVNNTAYGYILAGMEVLPQHYSKPVLLVVDTTHYPDFEQELQQWKENRRLSNQRVYTLEVSPTDLVQQVKARILEQYQLHPDLATVFLFGRVPVPYSGNDAPDGHIPNHQGAWPADGYYGELNGNWTDVNVNSTLANQVRNHNTPGDGKFDQNYFPGSLELQVGRVDLSSLPQLGSEPVLLKKYLQKDNAFYEGRIRVREKALIDDNFPTMGEAFAASAWQTFSSAVGIDSVFTTDYFTSMRAGSYLWSYGCGAGGYSSCAGIGNSSDYGVDSLENIFTMTFGSYFGDWDNSNNFLRAALAQGAVLSNAWSGRPSWFFHQMALGESLGFCALKSMNNSSEYASASYNRAVHMGLMGDPTIRSYAPPVLQNVTASFDSGLALLLWDPSDLPGVKYFVYRRNSDIDTFRLITETPLEVNVYNEDCPDFNGVIEYMVRPVVLKQGNSGSYYALGAGRSDTLLSNLIPLPEFDITAVVNENVVNFSAPDGASGYTWNFGDGTSSEGQTVTHTYAEENATYTVSVILSNGCIQESSETNIEILINGIHEKPGDELLVFPNPANDKLMISFKESIQVSGYHLYDATGRKQLDGVWSNDGIPVASLNAGIYTLLIQLKDDSTIRKRVIIVH